MVASGKKARGGRPAYYGDGSVEIMKILSGVGPRDTPPSMRMLAVTTGFALGTIYNYVRRMADEGLVTSRVNGRDVRLTPKGEHVLRSMGFEPPDMSAQGKVAVRVVHDRWSAAAERLRGIPDPF
jgi:predicted transcriptional regulator